jgi:hypothetical protein
MKTREDVKREVTRMLDDDSIRKPRVLQFFRDYFDYDLGGYICKDTRALAATGVSNRGTDHYSAMFDATASTDRLIELVLAEDKNVLKELLTTQRVVATKTDNTYFGRKHTKEEQAAAVAAKKKAEEELTQKEAARTQDTEGGGRRRLEAKLKDNPDDKQTCRSRSISRSKLLANAEKRIDNARRERKRGGGANVEVAEANLTGPPIYARVSRPDLWRRLDEARAHPGHRSLKASASASSRIRPGSSRSPTPWTITPSIAASGSASACSAAAFPTCPSLSMPSSRSSRRSTLRERMRVTKQTYCWTCHEKMDPLGLPFEMYNHAGIFRTTELDKPVTPPARSSTAAIPRSTAPSPTRSR